MRKWEELPGQEKWKRYFLRAAQTGQISHAYILSGEPGTPGMDLAENFARILQCERRTGCGECRFCRMVDGGSHPDVIHVLHEKPDVIRVEEIRAQLVNDMGIRPYYGPYKIYLVDEAEKMNPAAQNALLKTLEEPPSYGIIFLITASAGAFLPTILSRSVCLKIINPGRGEDLLDQEERAAVLSVLKRAQTCDRLEIAETAAEWVRSEVPLAYRLNLIRVWFRDILVWKDQGREDALVLKEELPAIQEAAGAYSWRQIQGILTETDRTQRRVTSHVNPELSIEILLSDLRVAGREEQ